MIRSDKKLNDLALTIGKDNKNSIITAIELLRDDEPFEGAIGLLTSLYEKTDDFSVKKSIEGFMSDLKDQTASAEVIVELRKELKPDTISMLVASCWQSGLNYADYVTDFALIFLKSDYVVALECLTVIEESSQELSRQKKNEIKKIILEKPLLPNNEIKALIGEMISILDK